jgi:hypothetical protein
MKKFSNVVTHTTYLVQGGLLDFSLNLYFNRIYSVLTAIQISHTRISTNTYTLQSIMLMQR